MKQCLTILVLKELRKLRKDVRELNRKVDILLEEERILMADAVQFQKDLDGVKDAVNKAADRVVKAIQSKGPLTQEQTDAADQVLVDIHTALDNIAPDQPVVVPPVDAPQS